MPNFSDSAFEAQYKHFLSVQAEWMALVQDSKIYNDTDAQKQPFRPVGFISDKSTYQRAQHLLAEWQNFADMTDKRRKERWVTVLKEVYSPVPTLKHIAGKIMITRREAITTKDHPRESLLKRYDSLISKLSNSKYTTKFIRVLEDERKFFEDQEPGAKFRLRTSGSTDTFIEIKPEGSTSTERTRVGSHGALLFSETMTASDIIYRDMENDSYASVYDNIAPIHCSLFDNAELFDLKKLDFETRYRAAYARVVRHRTTTQAVTRRRDQETLERYQGTPRYERIVARQQLQNAARKWIQEKDTEILARMREVNYFEVRSITAMRAQFLTEEELKSGNYAKGVLEARQELIKQGIPLYTDMVKK